MDANNNTLKILFNNILLAISLIIILILFIELTFYFYPRLIPSKILYKMSNNRIIRKYGNDPNIIVEKLNYSPWAKFKPDVEIVDAVRPNEVKTFVSRWRSDSRGFKNPPEAGLRKITSVILGDSHVEGVGVGPDQTFSALLSTKYHYSSYNLGVQGYGPQQMLGAYINYGVSFNPEYVIFCYNGSLCKRAVFLEKGKLTGGISSKLSLDEMRNKSSLLTESVLLTGLKSILRHIYYRALGEPVSIKFSDTLSNEKLLRYLSIHVDYYLSKNYYDTSDSEISNTMQYSMNITKRTIMQLDETVNKTGAKLVVFIMPTSRYLIEIVYPINYKEIMNNSYIEFEYKANDEIRDFAIKNHIQIINGITPVRDYLQNCNVQEELLNNYSKLPFFNIDGHPSQIGHEIYAKIIADYLRHHSSDHTAK